MTADGLADHGVLPHQHRGVAAQRGADGLHLLGADIVDADDETLGILIQVFLGNDK